MHNTNPRNDEGPRATASLQSTNQTSSLDFARESAADQAATDEQKSYWTLRAEYALAGYALHHLATGEYLACKWNLSRPLPSLEAARAFLRRVGGARHG